MPYMILHSILACPLKKKRKAKEKKKEKRKRKKKKKEKKKKKKNFFFFFLVVDVMLRNSRQHTHPMMMMMMIMMITGDDFPTLLSFICSYSFMKRGGKGACMMLITPLDSTQMIRKRKEGA